MKATWSVKVAPTTIGASASKPGRRRLLPLLTAGAVVGLFVSCATVTRVVMAPPAIPGAEFIGSEACADCHDELVNDFKTAPHARLLAEGENALEIGCESCHGPGSLHSESGGELNTIFNPKKSAEVCFQCHLDKRATFNLPYHHPVPEGRLTCSDCHDLHKGEVLTRTASVLLSENDRCLECHTAQRGPFVFEHEASREGCTTCHTPHGSVNAKLLTARNASLCLKCHLQQQTGSGQILIGTMPHTALLSHGTCWTAGCHEAVHGSQVNSHLRF